MAIYEFFTSRNNGTTADTYVGQAGRLFYDGITGVLKISDGVTPGGANIQLPVATTTLLGGIKAGPGANVSVDGTLTIDTSGLPLGIGNLSFVDTTISAVNANADVIIEANGTGNVELVGNIHFHTTASGGTGTPFFNASSDGQITILVPASDPAAGAVKIIGSQSGRVFPPLNTGVMLQLTGNNNDPSRFYNDAINSFPAFVGRRINGNLTVPTAVLAGDDLLRISVTGYNGVTVPGAGSGRILFQSLETYTPTAAGSNISIWTTAIGSNVLAKTATFDSANGLTVTRATIQGNIIAGNVNTTYLTGTLLTAAQTNITSVGTLSGLSVTGGITSGGIVSDQYGSVRSIPLNTQSSAYILTANDNGNLISITTGNVTVNAGIFNAPYGQAISVFNNSTNTMSIVQGTSVTLRLAGTATTGTRSMARYGVASLICVAANTFVISGAGIS